MFDALETGIGLDVILWLQNHRFALLNVWVHILNFAGHELVYIAAFGILYWMINKKLGWRMYFALMTISLLTFFFKDLLARPRPYDVSATVIPLFTERGFGIPSGHVSITLVVWGYLAWWLKKPGVTLAVVIYVLMQAIGHMVAGVHFPQDVIGGLLLGAIVLVAYIPLAERFVTIWSGWTITVQIVVSAGVVLVITVLTMLALDGVERWHDYLTLAGLLLGGSLAAVMEPHWVKFAPHEDIKRRIVQYVVGIVVVVLVLFGLDLAFKAITETGTLAGLLRVLRYGIVAFVALGLWPYLSVRLGLMQSESKAQQAEPQTV